MATGLEELAKDLRQAGDQASEQARRVVAKAATNVKNDWRDNARRSSGRAAARYPYSITYDIDATEEQVSARVGPDARLPQGKLGVILEFGTPTSPPHNDGGRALREEEPRFIQAIERLADEVLG